MPGRVVQLVADPGGTGPEWPAPIPEIATTTVLLTRSPAEPTGAEVRPATCISTSPDAWTAYAIVAGVPEDRLGGTLFLIDANGWLRRREQVAPAEEKGARETLAEHIRKIAADPFQAAEIGTHSH